MLIFLAFVMFALSEKKPKNKGELNQFCETCYEKYLNNVLDDSNIYFNVISKLKHNQNPSL